MPLRQFLQNEIGRGCYGIILSMTESTWLFGVMRGALARTGMLTHAPCNDQVDHVPVMR